MSENIIVYITYIDADTAEPKCEFFKIKKKVSGGTGAKNIRKIVTGLLNEYGLLDRVFFLGSDGASVMTGKNTGVAVRLREGGLPWLLAVHCICHRLALGAGDAAKFINFSTDIDKLLRSVHSLLKCGD